MAERDYALRIAKRSGNQEQWNEYRRLKNFTNRKIKSAEALHYKNLIESAENPKDMWRSLNSVIGSNNQGGLSFSSTWRETFSIGAKKRCNKIKQVFCCHWQQSCRLIAPCEIQGFQATTASLISSKDSITLQGTLAMSPKMVFIVMFKRSYVTDFHVSFANSGFLYYEQGELCLIC